MAHGAPADVEDGVGGGGDDIDRLAVVGNQDAPCLRQVVAV